MILDFKLSNSSHISRAVVLTNLISVAPPPDEPTSVSDDHIPKPPPFQPPNVLVLFEYVVVPFPPTYIYNCVPFVK